MDNREIAKRVPFKGKLEAPSATVRDLGAGNMRAGKTELALEAANSAAQQQSTWQGTTVLRACLV